MIPFSIIVAVDAKLGIGQKGTLPWQLSADLKHFKEITTGVSDPNKVNAVIMGRKTWDSLPEKFRPLPNRVNIVISRNASLKLAAGVELALDLAEAFHIIEKRVKSAVEKVFVIGGGQIFAEAIGSAACQRLYLTRLKNNFNCDTFFPSFSKDFKLDFSSSVFVDQKVGEYYFAEYARLKR